MLLLTKSECAVSLDINTQHPIMASLQIPKYQEGELQGKKTSMWGMNTFLKKCDMIFSNSLKFQTIPY